MRLNLKIWSRNTAESRHYCLNKTGSSYFIPRTYLCEFLKGQPPGFHAYSRITDTKSDRNLLYCLLKNV